MEVTDCTPSNHFSFSELQEGQEVTQKITFTEEIVESFMEISEDRSRIHYDAQHSSKLGIDRPVVHGLLVAAPFSRLIAMYLPGENCILQTINLKYRRPTHCTQELTYTVRINRLRIALKVAEIDLSVTSDGGEHLTGDGRAQLLAG